MDPISQARFDTLRKTDPIDWSEDDRGFMFARRGYLREDEVNLFGLNESPVAPSPEAVPSEPVAPVAAGKGKKTAAQ